MPFFLDTQETVQRFSNAMAEFRSLLDTNHIRHGSPDDLFEFARTLENGNQFRLDLSALVKSVVKKERGELLLTDMMSIIAASVGGRSIADTRSDITKPTNTLMEFLLGTGCWSQFGSPSRPSAQNAAPPLKPSLHTEESEPIRVSPPVAPVAIPRENPESRTNLLDISNELRETLSRLESSAQQVKLHLDSLEQRIGNIEPAPDVLPERKHLTPDPPVHHIPIEDVARNIAQPRVEDIPASEPELPTRGRAVFSHPIPPEESQVEGDDFSSPTFAYASDKDWRIVPVVIFLVLAAILAAFLFSVHSGAIQGFFHRVQTSAEHVPTAIPPPTAVPTSPAAATVSTPPSQDGAPSTAKADTTPTDSSEPNGANPNVSSSATPLIENHRVRYIPANIMEGYLLSAPRPEYPPSARIDHIEGQVALFAIISPTGSIETLHVIKGPQRLRSAAIDAASNWRYKPFFSNGQPVKVSTTVYVDFTLRPPPEIAH